MDSTYTYPSFDYLNVTYYLSPGYSGSLFYEGVLRRFFKNIELETSPFNQKWLDPCFLWTGNKSRLLSHKYLGMVPIRRISLALFLPEELNQCYTPTLKRLRFNIRSRCRNTLCLRPDHHIIKNQMTDICWSHRPAKRNLKHKRSEWLSYPEMNFFQAQMRMGIGSPAEFLIRYAERINQTYETVGAVWLQLHDTMIKEFKDRCL